MPSVGEAPYLRHVTVRRASDESIPLSPPRVMGFQAPQPNSAYSDDGGKPLVPISPLSQALRSEQSLPRLVIRKPARAGGSLLGRRSCSYPDLKVLANESHSSLARSASGSLRSEPVAIPSRSGTPTTPADPLNTEFYFDTDPSSPNLAPALPLYAAVAALTRFTPPCPSLMPASSIGLPPMGLPPLGGFAPRLAPAPAAAAATPRSAVHDNSAFEQQQPFQRELMGPGLPGFQPQFPEAPRWSSTAHAATAELPPEERLDQLTAEMASLSAVSDEADSVQPMLFDLEVPPPPPLAPLPMPPPLSLRALRRPGAAALERAAAEEAALISEKLPAVADSAAQAEILLQETGSGRRSSLKVKGGPSTFVSLDLATNDSPNASNRGQSPRDNAAKSGFNVEVHQQAGGSPRQQTAQRCYKSQHSLLRHSRSALWVAAIVCSAGLY